MSYLGVQYAEGRVDRSDYPEFLIAMLADRYDPLYAVLELGPGRGDFMRAWKEVAVDVRAMDAEPSDNTIDRGDLNGRLPYEDATFDVVFSKSVIEHMVDPTAMMREARRVLRQGGRLILMTPDWRTYMQIFYDDYTHVRPYDAVSLPDLLKAHGFKRVTGELVYQHVPILRNRLLRFLAPVWRWLAPLQFSLWLSKTTGVQYFKWASLLTVLAVGVKE